MSLYRSLTQDSACAGGVMSSPSEQKTMMGEAMLRRSTRVPSAKVSSPVAKRLPMKS